MIYAQKISKDTFLITNKDGFKKSIFFEKKHKNKHKLNARILGVGKYAFFNDTESKLCRSNNKYETSGINFTLMHDSTNQYYYPIVENKKVYKYIENKINPILNTKPNVLLTASLKKKDTSFTVVITKIKLLDR